MRRRPSPRRPQRGPARWSVVADETRRELPDKPVRERGLHQSDFMRRGTLDVDGNREPLTIGDSHDLRPLAALRLAHAGASLLRWCEAPIDQGFLQVQMAFVVESLGKDALARDRWSVQFLRTPIVAEIAECAAARYKEKAGTDRRPGLE